MRTFKLFFVNIWDHICKTVFPKHFCFVFYTKLDRSGTCQIKIRRQPDQSGCCLIKIRQLPDRSSTCQIKIRWQPDRSSCCLIKIRHAWYQANLAPWSILLRQIRQSGKWRKFVRSLYRIHFIALTLTTEHCTVYIVFSL